MSNLKNTQYQQNIDITKGFFKKPIVLVTGILTLLSTVVASVVSVFTFTAVVENLNSIVSQLYTEYGRILGDYQILFSVDDSSSAPSLDLYTIATGVALILLFAFGRNKSNGIVGAAKYYKVLASIEYVFSIIFAVFCVLAIIITFTVDLSVMHKAIVILSLLLIATIAFGTSFSKVTFTKSVCEGMNSIYLSLSGAKALGMFTFIGILAQIMVISVMVVFNVNTAIIAGVAFDILPKLLFGIMAFMYDSYIGGVYSGKTNLPVNMVQEEQVNESCCSNCGNPITEEDVFCHVCGNRVK